ncbi:MAG TPA: RsmB/NOP family class I SAM-dependent RNA methyltransferase [Burkholderiales bacterium]|nr:RsmB/NOP family class I SAM-dependent RNA methyltransferase [Burkholderiales bacterium]
MQRKLLDAATEALGRVLKFEQPADAVLSAWFREHHALGPHDRAFVAEGVFGVLRHKRTLERVVGTPTARRLLLGWVARHSGMTAKVKPLVKPAEAEALETYAAAAPELTPAERAELPDWVFERVGADLGEAGALALGASLQEPAPLDLRVNTLKADRHDVLKSLRGKGIPAEPTPYSPAGVRIFGKPAINRDPLFTEGALEVQDEGSQLVGYLLAPTRHDLVVDFCAGAGGKSLMLGAMMRSQGRLYAFDVSAARLARLKPRLKRSGLSNVHPHQIANEHDPKVKRLGGKIDRVLVDAPCTGLGTLRRNPDLKWRQSPQTVVEMRAKQAAILRAAASLVKPGGRLVYATCSVLTEENEAIVASFLDETPGFGIVKCSDLLKHHGIDIDVGQTLRLWPHIHGTDGFFAAALERAR